jgi:hypothetical protein
LASGKTHERVDGHVGEATASRSPDLEIGLAETGEHLADSEIMMRLQ